MLYVLLLSENGGPSRSGTTSGGEELVVFLLPLKLLYIFIQVLIFFVKGIDPIAKNRILFQEVVNALVVLVLGEEDEARLDGSKCELFE